MARSTEGHPQPPAPPELERRIALRPPHAIGGAALLVIVILAATGVFDDSEVEYRGFIDGAGIVVTAPSQVRFKREAIIEIAIEDDRNIDSLRVLIDEVYLQRFKSVRPLPVPAGGDRRSISFGVAGARIEMNAVRAGAARGRLTIEAAGDSVEFDLRTIILP